MRGQYKQTPSQAKRPERDAAHRSMWAHNRQIILATQSICGICGKPVDKTLKSPDPMSPVVDHIIPVSRNGDPVSLDNLQLAHRYCNRQKGDKLPEKEVKKVDPNRDLPQSANWRID